MAVLGHIDLVLTIIYACAQLFWLRIRRHNRNSRAATFRSRTFGAGVMSGQKV